MATQHDKGYFHSYSDLTQVCIEVNQSKILVPSIFSPFTGPETIGFEIKGLESMYDNSLYIVNHLGKEVYKARNYKNEWTAVGLDDGDYYFLLMVKASANSEWTRFKGCIILKRARRHSI